jgi:hypothetical protein
MANFLLTVFLSFIIILVALLVFRYISPPVYRVEAINIKRLLESALDSDVTSADWDVFIEIPIRHDPQLDEIRRECAMLTASEISERQGMMIFSATARQKLMDFHKQVNQKIEASGSQND